MSFSCVWRRCCVSTRETVLRLDAAHVPIGREMAWSIKMPEALAAKGGAYHLPVEIELS